MGDFAPAGLTRKPGAAPVSSLAGMGAFRHSSLRVLAPASLVVFAIVFLIVVIASLAGAGDSSSTRPERADDHRSTDAAARSRCCTARGASGGSRKRGVYVVRTGDNLFTIANKTGVPIETLRALNPTARPAGAGHRPARPLAGRGREGRDGREWGDGRERIDRRRRPRLKRDGTPRRLPTKALLALLAAALLAAPAAGRAAPSDTHGRPRIGAPAAIVVDARDGRVLYRRDANTRRPIASVTKLMTALLSVEMLPLRAPSAGRALRRRPGGVAARARARGADDGRGPDARAAARERERRGRHAGARRRRVGPRFVTPDEPQGAGARPDPYALREPGRPRRGRQLLDRA